LERNSQIYQHHTRGKNKIHIRACRATLFQKYVLHSAVGLYNKLPERIRVLESFRSFKKEVKSLLITNTVYSVDKFLKVLFYLKIPLWLIINIINIKFINFIHSS
jgi:hypothetical protein